MRRAFAFDLDGTVTLDETLPLLARELDLAEEMALLTQLTLAGKIAFERSFRLRFHILRSIPVARIQEIMDGVRLDAEIADFIRERREECAIVTGNLDVWVQPIVEKLGCRAFASRSGRSADGALTLESILDKGEAVRCLRRSAAQVVAVGDGLNDIPMFEAADVAISYGGIHRPAAAALAASDYAAFGGGALCRLLRAL